MAFASSDRWLLPLLHGITKRPGQFIGCGDVRSLELFLLGYRQARIDLGLPEFGPEDADLLADFSTWLAVKLRDNRNTNWAGFISVMDRTPKSIKTFVREFAPFLRSRGLELG